MVVERPSRSKMKRTMCSPEKRASTTHKKPMPDVAVLIADGLNISGALTFAVQVLPAKGLEPLGPLPMCARDGTDAPRHFLGPVKRQHVLERFVR